MTAPIEVVYSDALLDWRLGAGHPTNPERATNALALLEDDPDLDVTVVAPTEATAADLMRVHTRRYVHRTLRGVNDQWNGRQPRLGQVASLMAGGTLDAARRIIDGTTRRVFVPQGAKHHAMADHGSGFCTFNDMAAAAYLFRDAGMRVLYVDWDAHHGDGVEALLFGATDLVTWSVHNIDNFPGTGHATDTFSGAFNVPLRWGTGGDVMVDALDTFLTYMAPALDPDVVLVATGADGHYADPLGGLDYEVDHFTEAGQLVRTFADTYCQGRVLVGGAGGYRPNDWTPLCWYAAVRAIAGAPGVVPSTLIEAAEALA